MTPLRQAFVNEAFYAAGVYGAVSLGRNHLPVSPRTAVTLIVAVKAIQCVSILFIAMSRRKMNEAKDSRWYLDCGSDEWNEAIKIEKKWELRSDRAKKLYSIIPNLILGLGVASNFISPGGAVTVAGIDSICRNIFHNEFLDLKDIQSEVYKAFA